MKKEWWIGTVIGTLISLLALKFGLDGKEIKTYLTNSKNTEHRPATAVR